MPVSTLKKYRVRAALTQKQVASKVKVTQPTYHRWEVGLVPVPEDKLTKLAKLFNATPEALLGKHAPVEASYTWDERAPADLQYYGEVAIHFRSGGPPLVLTLSEAEFSRLHLNLQEDEQTFVDVQSMCNQTVAIRLKAVSDIYFSSDAWEDFGPLHGTYEGYDDPPPRLPDSRDWAIIEALGAQRESEEGTGFVLAVDPDLTEFDPEDVERVRGYLMITDRQYSELVAQGLIKAEDLEAERAKNAHEHQKRMQRILELASTVVYQLSSGEQRRPEIPEREQCYEAFSSVMDNLDPPSMFRLEAEGRHRIIFINADALDYVSIPTHWYEAGEDESRAEELDIEG